MTEEEREGVLERESKELEKSSSRRRMRANALIIQQIKLRKHKEEEGIKRPLALTYKSHVSVDMYPCLYVCICICVCKCIYRCSSAVRDTIFMNDIEHTQTHTHTPGRTHPQQARLLSKSKSNVALRYFACNSLLSYSKENNN